MHEILNSAADKRRDAAAVAIALTYIAAAAVAQLQSDKIPHFFCYYIAHDLTLATVRLLHHSLARSKIASKEVQFCRT